MQIMNYINNHSQFGEGSHREEGYLIKATSCSENNQ
jgi:hypothetical protein